MTNDLTVTTAHLRELLHSTVESPVLYVVRDDNGVLSLDTWAEAYVWHHAVVAHRHELIDWVGESPDDDLLDGALADCQQAADEAVVRLS